MKIAGQTDIGSCRQENQDNFCARQLTDGSGWGVVCDGMGGVRGGRVASSIATASMLQYFDRQLHTLRHGEEKQFILQSVQTSALLCPADKDDLVKRLAQFLDKFYR